NIGTIVADSEERDQIGCPDANFGQRLQLRISLRVEVLDILLAHHVPDSEVVAFVELDEIRLEPGFDRALPEQATTERVYRAYETFVDVQQCFTQSHSLVPGRRGRCLNEALGEPLLQLPCRFACEGDGDELIDMRVAASDARDHPPNQRFGLARSGA